MDTNGTQEVPAAAVAAAADSPCMLLAPYGKWDADEDFFSTADSKTVASACTSNGHLIAVGLHRAPPPAMLRICLHFPRQIRSAFSTVVAAHGGTILIHIWFTTVVGAVSYLVYNGDAGGGDPTLPPPTLSLLPPPPDLPGSKIPLLLDITATGILRRGRPSAEFVVAELRIMEGSREPVLRIFRSGKWHVVKRPPVIHGLCWRDWEMMLGSWTSDAVVPLGGELLCWVDVCHGAILCDVFDDRPTLRHVPYPVMNRTSYLCVGVGGAVKLLYFSVGYCSKRGCSHHGHGADAWTMKEDATGWAMDSAVDNGGDCTELWAMDCCRCQARVQLLYNVERTKDGVSSSCFFKRDCCTN